MVSGLQALAGVAIYLLQGGFGAGHGPLDGLFWAVQLPGVYGMGAAAVLQIRPAFLNVLVMFAVPFLLNLLWWQLAVSGIRAFRIWLG
jgi:hypothetical protein